MSNPRNALGESEVKLLLLILSGKKNERLQEEIQQLLLPSLNWSALLEFADKNQVLKPFYHRLNLLVPNCIPQHLAEKARAECEFLSAQTMLYSKELFELLEIFAAENLSIIPLKGPALTLLYYNEIANRQFSDLDLLIRPKDLCKAREILLGRGYQADLELNQSEERAQIKHQHALNFIQPQTGLFVDLHWNILQRIYSIHFDLDQLWKRAQPVEVKGKSFLFFEPEDLLLLLCVHSAKHLWERLAWVCDIERFLLKENQLNFHEVLRRAKKLGITRMLIVSVGLTSRIFDMSLPQPIADKLEQDSQAEKLITYFQRTLFTPAERSIFSNCLLDIQLREKLSDKVRYTLRRLLTPHIGDWSEWKLPRALFPLHYLLRPLRLLKRHSRRAVSAVFGRSPG